MLTPFVLTYRKWRSSGFSNTAAAIWEEIYRKRILNPYVATHIWDKSGLYVGTQSDFMGASEAAATSGVHAPRKAWIGESDFSEVQKYSIGPPSVYSVADCVVFRPNGLAITSDGRIIADTISPPNLLDNRQVVAISKIIFENGILWSLDELKREKIKQRAEGQKFDLEQACPLLPLWPNYYHWTIDCLPRLRAIERWYQRTGDVTTLLIPPDPPSWMAESIELLASDSYKTCEFTDASQTVRKLIVPTYPDPSPVSCRWLREKSTADVDPLESNSNRIYISREQANRRRVANRDEIEDVLSQFGFKSYVLEELSVRDQVRLFMNAEVVVSPHGAGLANIVYADEPVIVELFGSRKKTTFYRLAEILDHEYHHVCGQDHVADIVIDPEELLETLQATLEDST